MVRTLASTPLLAGLDRRLNTAPIIFTLHRRARPEHGIGGHDPHTLRTQLELLSRLGYRTVTMDQVDTWLNGEDIDLSKAVAFTFDDGYQDQAELIEDVLLPLGMPPSMFLITDFLDGRDWPWDARIRWLLQQAPARLDGKAIDVLGADIIVRPGPQGRRASARAVIRQVQHQRPEVLRAALDALATALGVELRETPPECHRPISWDQARALERQGVRFGSHSVNHFIFSTLSEEQARHQIESAYPRLRAELDSPLAVFAYPIGFRSDYTGRELRLLAELGHTSAVTMVPGVVQRHSSGRFLPRFGINRYGMPDTLVEFAQCLSWVERAQDGVRRWSPRTLVNNQYGSPRGLLRAWGAFFDHRFGRLGISARVDWSKVQRLVFVCLGNVCRSPFAEAVARDYGIPAISFGLNTNRGTPANAVASRIALEIGVDMTRHESRMLKSEDLQPGDLVLGMEPVHLDDPRLATARPDVQVSLLGLLDPRAPTPYIHDPFGASDAYFGRCFESIRSTVKHIRRQLPESPGIG